MKRIAPGIIRYRDRILGAALTLCVLCGLLALRVPINADMTKYLPASSPMKQGIDVMTEELGELSMPGSIRVMFRDLPEEERSRIRTRLSEMDGVESVSVTGPVSKEGAEYLLYTISTPLDYRSPGELALEHGILDAFQDYDVVLRNDDTMGMEIPLIAYVLAVTVLLAVLFVMCQSWVEPFLFLAAIGVAILINMGTNLILGSVSQTTYSMSAILQLVLSMDYSIILMNRYRQEKAARGISGKALSGRGRQGKDREPTEALREREQAMTEALRQAFPSIASSGFTTLVGLLMLVFMQFRIGRDLGLVLAKGVFWSMVCVLTLLPALILRFDRWIERTAKRSLSIPTKALSAFSYRFRYALTAGFVLLFCLAFFLQKNSQISFSLQPEDPIAEIFPASNSIVLLYDNADEAQIGGVAAYAQSREKVTSVLYYGNSIGKMENFVEDNALLSGLFGGGSRKKAEGGAEEGSEEETEKGTEGGSNEDAGGGLFSAARRQMVGEKHSLMMIAARLPVEGEETTAFLEGLREYCDAHLSGDYYLIGNSPMSLEMQEGFGSELLLITLLTAVSIFLVVAVTFRKLSIPVILVSLVQCGVYLAVTTVWLLGYRIYYLAILIVQCILMGATVDYGILMTGYYREFRQSCGGKEALSRTCAGAIHTILTSSLFMIFGTGTIAMSPVDPTISQICQSIAIGAVCAVLLVIFVLPGILAAFDRFVLTSRKRV